MNLANDKESGTGNQPPIGITISAEKVEEEVEYALPTRKPTLSSSPPIHSNRNCLPNSKANFPPPNN